MTTHAHDYPPVQLQQKPLTSGFGVTALVLGIIGLVFSWVPILDVVLGALAIIFGGVGLGLARQGRAAGKGMAIAGLVCGIVTVAIFGALLAWGASL